MDEDPKEHEAFDEGREKDGKVQEEIKGNHPSL